MVIVVKKATKGDHKRIDWYEMLDDTSVTEATEPAARLRFSSTIRLVIVNCYVNIRNSCRPKII